MREIEYTTKFKRQYKKLEISLKEKTKDTISKLWNNHFPRDLNVHKLSWKLSQYYACSIDYKNRIIFEIQDNWKLLLLLVWVHSIYDI